MDRLELIRCKVDAIISKLANEEDRKFAYIHSYGVSQIAILLAGIRGLSSELAGISAMLHDIAIYAQNCPHAVHAQKSAELSKELLLETQAFSEEEINVICNAISLHSNKLIRNDSRFAELLKDSDVLQHYLYNPLIPLQENDKFRLFYLLEDIKKIQTKADT